MNYKIIGSSSKGNCIVIENILMLDVGLSYIRIKEYLKNVKLIFISHQHHDHLLPSTIKKIAYNYPNIKFICGSREVVKKLFECGIQKKNIYMLKEGKKYDLGALIVKLEPLYHDTPNYALKWQINGKKGIYIVDSCKADHIEAKNYDLILIESNYNKEVLEEHILECDNQDKLYYLNRVPNTHLEYGAATDFLLNNMGDNTVYERIHKSSYNYEEID